MKHQPTILMATPYFYPRIGGMENYAYNIARGLQAAGWRVVVACGDTSVSALQKRTEDGLIVYRLPVGRVVSNTPVNFGWYRMLKTIIRTEQPALINAHTPVPFMADMAALAAGRTPLVITYHAVNLMKPGSLIMTAAIRAYLLIQSFTLRRANRVIAVSNDVKTALGARIGRKTYIVFNAVAKAGSAKRSGAGLVFVANLEPTHAWKGLGLIIEALGLMKAKNQTPPHLTVIGDGGARAGYEQQVAALGLTDAVTFAGRLTGAARDRLMRRAAALIAYPTTANDAFPTVFLEAWAQGLAIIAAGIGPIPSLIDNGHTGALVPANNPKALAAALATLFANPKALHDMGAAGQKLVATTYNWPTQVQRTAEILETLI